MIKTDKNKIIIKNALFNLSLFFIMNKKPAIDINTRASQQLLVKAASNPAKSIVE